ncbi:type VII secretion protein EccB [Streptomyces xanthochromogenes]|uniref:type VII secretion protein EccB n=1 Tax=Streptomyces xanthochromogenes TaxID=67384 RepID=UPI00167C3D3D|nr:type VII secretion protein EccB [Streptomyces xanthochromogenes]GHB48182.1 type VII secretion protein EccB [Streptomyces xanthochromogenes]
MASRRDELNAYTFAKRRTLASFIQPSPTGSEEGAPRPLRAVLPGTVMAVVLLAAFGAWGMFKPTAPPGWDTPGEKVIIASESTTRYVVLTTDGRSELHPVLNMASAKLLLAPDKGQVVKVDESVLDKGSLTHGATLGIPYAPDRLPSAKEAGSAKRWAVCERPGDGGRAIQKAAFVLADRDMNRTDGDERLTGGELMFVIGAEDKTRYIVDARGTKYPVGSDEKLLRPLVGSGREPERVSKEWLETLRTGDPVAFPKVEGKIGAPAGVPGSLSADANRIGVVLRATNGAGAQYYLVQRGKVSPVSDFTAKLLLNSVQLSKVMGTGQATATNASMFSPEATEFPGNVDWPRPMPVAVNEAGTANGSRNTVCNVLRDVNKDNGATTMSTWAGTDFPEPLPTGSSSAYVTPGSGQLFRQIQGSETEAGGVFLVTDTGLRYAMQSNSDSAAGDSGAGLTAEQRKQLDQEAQQAQTRLGYAKSDPAPIPISWSTFLPTGPRLSTGAARQPQGS